MRRSVINRVVAGLAMSLILGVSPMFAADPCEAFSLKVPKNLDDNEGKTKLSVKDGLYLMAKYSSQYHGLLEYKTEVKDGLRVADSFFQKGVRREISLKGPKAEPTRCQEVKPATASLMEHGETMLLGVLDLLAPSSAFAADTRGGLCRGYFVEVRCYGGDGTTPSTCVAQHYCGQRFVGNSELCGPNTYDCPAGSGRPGPKGKRGGSNPAQ